jgi:hypothetical protein
MCDMGSDWEKIKNRIEPTFGARVFLIENLRLDSIDGLWMLDIDKPDTATIPDLGALVISLQ